MGTKTASVDINMKLGTPYWANVARKAWGNLFSGFTSVWGNISHIVLSTNLT
jgi:hypothetical protein